MIIYNIIMTCIMSAVCIIFLITTINHISDNYYAEDFAEKSDLKNLYFGTKILIGISICSFVLMCVHIFLACIL